MLNTDLNFFFKRISYKTTLPSPIALKQTAYVKKRHIGKREGLISDIYPIDISDKLNKWLFSYCQYRKSFRRTRSWIFAGHFKRI